MPITIAITGDIIMTTHITRTKSSKHDAMK